MADLVRTTQASAVPHYLAPSMILLAKNAPALMVLMDTLGKCEYEMVAAHLIHASQEASKEQGKTAWVAVVLDERCDYSNMIEDGLITETQVADGWQYELTLMAIERIYVRQSQYRIRRLIHALECAEMPWWQKLSFKLKDMFSTPLAFLR